MLKETSLADFIERSVRGVPLPVYREFLADTETPVSVLARVVGDENVFLLESVAGHAQRARYSFLGVDPRAIVTQEKGAVHLRSISGTDEVLPEADVLSAMRRLTSARGFFADPDLPPLQGGAIGFLAYDAVKTFEPRVALREDPGTPQAAFMITDSVVIFDNVRQTVLIVRIVDSTTFPSPTAAYEATREEISALHTRLFEQVPPCTSAVPKTTPFQPEMTEAEFTDIVRSCKDAVINGECIQIVPSQKFTAQTNLPPLKLYRALRIVNPSPYNFFLKLGTRTLIGSSPEELVKTDGHMATTCPIAGTRPRGATLEADLALEKELISDAKERAEHTMLVDLGRNDLGRVSVPGTVKVDSFAAVERYSHVMHLVSRVSGTLEAGRDSFDLLRAAFPAGTLTGAPKIRAMELISKLEKSPRGVYGGAAGYFSNTGAMDFAIVIRTMVLNGNELVMRAGAGIVADSDPLREYQETINKSKAVFEAVKFAETL